MATDLEVYHPQWIDLLEPAAELARLVGQTEFVPASLRNRGGAIAACVLYGAELGIGPMQSLAKVGVIDGRPAPTAELCRALVLGAGHELWLEAATNTAVTWAGVRKGSEHIQRATWTMDDARRASLDGKPNWRRYPRQMLSARASADLCRVLAPDVLGGITLTAEELQDGAEAPETVPEPVESSRPTRRRSLRAIPAAEAPAEPSVAPQDAHEAPDGPGTPDEPADGATAAQNRLMHALFHDVEVDGRAQRLALTSQILGRDVPTSKDLTSAEASTLIDELQRRKDEGWVAF